MNIVYKMITLALLLGCKGAENNTTTADKGLLWTVSWSPNGKYIATGGNQDTLRLISMSNDKSTQNYPFKNTITQLSWHPTSEKLAIASQISEEKTCLLYLQNGQRIILDSISQDGARAIGWNFDGTILGVGDNDGSLIFFDSTGKFIRKIDANQKSITGLSWHPKKNIVVSVGSQIGIYDFETDSLSMIKPRAYDILMLCVSWHPSGDIFVTGDYGDFDKNYPAMLQFWKSTGENIRNIEKSKLEYRNLKWDKAGEILATASDQIRIWNKNGDLIKEQVSKNALWGIDWNNKDNLIVTSDHKGIITIWDKDLNFIKELFY